MRLATWNINSIRARIDLLCDWLRRTQPDVLALQETKVVDELFPLSALEAVGYCAGYRGEKSYNGVALLARERPAEVELVCPLPGNSECRLLRASYKGVRLYSAYFPNGREPGTPPFQTKLAWIDQLGQLLFEQQPYDGPTVVMGDFNVAPEPRDVYDPTALEGKIHFTVEERLALDQLRDRGLVDAFRVCRSEAGLYSWWDYRQGMFRRNLGLRIDHVWTTPDLAAKAVEARIDVEERRKEHCSDHAPVVVDFDV